MAISNPPAKAKLANDAASRWMDALPARLARPGTLAWPRPAVGRTNLASRFHTAAGAWHPHELHCAFVWTLPAPSNRDAENPKTRQQTRCINAPGKKS